MDSLPELLEEHARRSGARTYCTFLRDGEHDAVELSYAQLHAGAHCIARVLADSVSPGSRIVLMYPNGLEFITAFFGVLQLGAVAVPVHAPQPQRPGGALEHLERIVTDSGAELILTTAALLEGLQAQVAASHVLSSVQWLASEHLNSCAPDADGWQRPPLAASSLALLQYTSGSTARPKGVMITHGNLLVNTAMLAEATQLPAQPFVWVSWLPHYHDMGLVGGLLTPFVRGAQVVLMTPQHFIQSPLRWLRAIDRYQAHCSCAPNFAYELCARAGSMSKGGLDLSRWRVALAGAEPVRAATLQRFAAAFAPSGFAASSFVPGYGLAENTLIVTAAPAGREPVVRRIDAAEDRGLRVANGAAPSTVTVQIVDPTTLRAVAVPGEEGEIWVQGPSVAAGYWRNPAATADTFAARITDAQERGAWLRTGDLGRIVDAELYVTGRLKDVVILDGRKIHPTDVEEFVQGLDARLKVGKGIVFGIATHAGEGLALAQEAALRDESQQQRLVRAIRAAVYEQFGVPLHTVLLVRSGGVPRTFNGKLRRHAGRQAFERGEFPVLFASSLEPAAGAGLTVVDAVRAS